MEETKCEICGEVMPDGSVGYWKMQDKGINAHVGCAEKEIEVFKVQSVSAGSFYFDDNLDNLSDMVVEAPFGDGYTVTKERMPAGTFKCLPEFAGF